MKKYLIWIVLGVIVVCAGLFLLSLTLDHTNPPVVQEPNWDSPQTRDLAKRACFDCHSNETTWPWYASIPPFSFLIQRDVNEGRSKLNFSEWGSGEAETDEIGEIIREGEMPPTYYTMLHASAKLSEAEKEALIQGLQATTGNTGDITGGGVTEEEDD